MWVRAEKNFWNFWFISQGKNFSNFWLVSQGKNFWKLLNLCQGSSREVQQTISRGGGGRSFNRSALIWRLSIVIIDSQDYQDYQDQQVYQSSSLILTSTFDHHQWCLQTGEVAARLQLLVLAPGKGGKIYRIFYLEMRRKKLIFSNNKCDF